ncbi:MAG TPA: S8 family serine peptidase [Flavobacterium sp.]
MKNVVLFIFFISGAVYSQEDAWVYFTAKPNAAFYFSNPLQMLSQRALDRREAQNIALDVLDVPIPPEYIEQVDAAAGITVMAKSKWLNAVHVRGSVAAINALENFTIVDHVDFADHSLDAAGRAASVAAPANTAQVLAEFPYGQSANQVEMLNGHLLHQQDFTGTGKMIAVMDAGFPQVDVAQPFQRLWDNNLILGGYNFVDRNTDIFTRNSHGTMVLSTMGGYTAGELVGTAPDASYYLFITEDTNSENPVEESYWVEAAEMADSLGVDVINTSLGYFSYDDPDYSYSFTDMNGTTAFVSRGADIAFSRGMVVVISAGNTGASEDPNITVPADAINVLTVGAVNPSEVCASFSSVGPTADGRVKPDVMAQGVASVIATPAGSVTTGNGTSFAGPIMAGMVASFWQAVPNKTNAEIIQLVKESADRFTMPTAQYGYGIPDFSLALSSALSVPKFIQYPNPVTGIFSVALPSGVTSAVVSVYDMSGKRVVNTTISNGNAGVSLENLSAGTYIYKVTSGSIVATGKLIKQ